MILASNSIAAETDCPDTKSLGRDGRAEDFDIRGLKVTMNVVDIKKFANEHGWNYSQRGSLKLLDICPQDVDCATAVYKDAPGSFRIEISYDDTGRVNTIHYDLFLKGSFSEAGKLLIEKYGKPLLQKPGDKTEYYYGLQTDPDKKTPSYAYTSSTFMMSARIISYDSGELAGFSRVQLTLNNPKPKIGHETKATQPSF